MNKAAVCTPCYGITRRQCSVPGKQQTTGRRPPCLPGPLFFFFFFFILFLGVGSGDEIPVLYPNARNPSVHCTLENSRQWDAGLLFGGEVRWSPAKRQRNRHVACAAVSLWSVCCCCVFVVVVVAVVVLFSLGVGWGTEEGGCIPVSEIRQCIAPWRTKTQWDPDLAPFFSFLFFFFHACI